jgi:hypothetical protein
MTNPARQPGRPIEVDHTTDLRTLHAPVCDSSIDIKVSTNDKVSRIKGEHIVHQILR